MTHKVARSISLCAILIAVACNFPRLTITPAQTYTPTPQIETEPSPASPPTAELGTDENPLILALQPSADATEIESANFIAAQLLERTGYTVVAVIPDSESALVNDFAIGNAHIALLSPYGYLLAHKQGFAKAAFALMRDGNAFYGAQFLARRDAGFLSYFDPASATNTNDDARAALRQFNGKKPCWTDRTSISGYVVPLGYLNANNVISQPAAFVEGHPTVVRSLYAGGICDFGATYIDARKFPSLEDQFPDLMERVIVIWRMPAIIPYETLALSSNMPAPMRNLFAKTILVLMQVDRGRAALETAYGIKELMQVNDAFYDEFRRYVEASNLDLAELIK
ncbi:MAG: PhnD/SsuA/transferrin family substrate-binding protein [Anaerolineaceae bacterium]|nr:PhnD/SsuA/transferrin family substrate-binding protein [Anaerolineaceae bacterium]